MGHDADDLEDHRLIIDSCLRHGIPFTWHGRGTLLIHSRGVPVVTADVIRAGYRILGLEGFDVDPRIRPRLDLIFDNSSSPEFRDPIGAEGLWTDDVWVDLTITLELPNAGG
jgi:hypothetical protein